ncbi:receptor-like protein Cf-9 homolog [Mangifera indica]|uniref:receptor-like protein Cf-9 homolog n=1 Tax=Mangifera indica TaxID=29780 RepID=UPI001CFABCB9|nr:receptor-like protein Cf-9 homolog [Mangifera indica]
MNSWKEEGDCCSWDGVTCDRETGHVIGLDLSCSWLHGYIPSNSTLFLLSHLQSLNLCYNDFNYSQISPGFGQFSDLTVLRLSYSNFSGQLPLDISHLSKLVVLDLSGNSQVILEHPVLEGMVQNLSKLEAVFLDDVDMSTAARTASFTNLSSSLIDLSLIDCRLVGYFPESILRLPNLRTLHLQLNPNLTGIFPKVNWSSPIETLNVAYTNFSGQLPNSISNVMSLRYLDLFGCNFFGLIPPSLANLTQLIFLGLGKNHFYGHIPSSLSNLGQLQVFDLSWNHLTGEIPSDIFVNLTQLSFVSFRSNQLVGPIPSRASGLQNLAVLSVNENMLNGSLPSWLFTLPRVEFIDLGYNQLAGHIVEFQCQFLESLCLDQNRFHGSIPVLPHSLRLFFISNNSMTGGITHLICNMSLIAILDLYNNNLSGTIPDCLGNFNSSLRVLDLQKNRMYGNIPDSFAQGNHLRELSINCNWLEGTVPRSLENCTKLEVLNIGNNNIKDIFPHWLSSLPELRVFVLRSNKFYGIISASSAEANHSFPKLRFFDISNNTFSGPLPTKYFESMKAMQNVVKVGKKLRYLGDGYYQVSLILNLKGSSFEMMKIINEFTIMDFSYNNFHGEIPKIIGNLHALQILNLSRNSLSGCIPSSFGNLLSLESLDLSSNKLTGEIPRQLTNLNFLEVLNLSNNHLTGSIPQNNQFNTFPNTSYGGNAGLCGFPLSNKCGDDSALHISASNEDDMESNNGFDWQVVLIGFGCGVPFGLIIGCFVFATGKP